MVVRSLPMSCSGWDPNSRWLKRRHTRHRRWQGALEITGAVGVRLCRFAHLDQPVRFVSEPQQRADGHFLEGPELELHIRFVLRKARGDAQDLGAKRDGQTQAQHGQCHNRNEH